jgi:hypothetical protein
MAVNQVKRNGSYAPLSCRYYQDDAIAKAGERAEVLYVRGLAFCAAQLSDGFISDIQLRMFVGVGLKGLDARAARLCEVKLWERVEEDLFGEGTGYRVKSWAKWNLTKGEIEQKQKADAARKAEARK